jgi:putative nucleotidyltransferase with HDIG domain
MRDPYTAGHQQRVAKITRAIAEELGLPEQQIEGLYLASVVHDVGKVMVPAEILSKPGKLTELEFSLIKQHSEAGYEILKEVDFPWPIAQFVLQHHEHLDGSGYPAGLKGEDILLEARILSVADIIEAMASHRPYRAGFGIEVALEEVSSKRDVLYDRAVVDAALRLFREKNFTI